MSYDICRAGAGSRHSIALTNCGKVFTWGKGNRDMKNSMHDFFEPKNIFDQQRFKALDLFFEKISCGLTHSAAVTSTGDLYMWGEATDGCLGRPPPQSNPKATSLLPMMVDFFAGKKVYNVASGELFTIVTTIDSKDKHHLFKIQQEEMKTHISSALKKKLSRRLLFK